MDITKRGANQPPSSSEHNTNSDKAAARRFRSNKWLNIASVILLFGVVVILVAIAFLPRSTNNSEDKYINSGVFQAVDVTVGGSGGDQIYFGNIKKLNSSYLVLQNVFYIPSTSSSSNVTLEPLICQIDAPFNQMVINRASVNWWENLQSAGKVAQAITSYEKSHSQTCPKVSSPASSPTSSSGSSSTSGQ